MDNPILLDIFGLLICAAFSIFLWDVILPMTRQKLKTEDHSTAKYFLVVISLVLFVFGVHLGFSVMSSVFDFNNPL